MYLLSTCLPIYWSPSLIHCGAYYFHLSLYIFSLPLKDWGVGYFVNYFNISRHVVPTGHTHPYKKKDDNKAYWYNDQTGDVKQARLHAWHDGSEIYQGVLGNCKNIGDKCYETSGACHNIDEKLFNSLYQKVKYLWPKKYRNLE